MLFPKTPTFNEAVRQYAAGEMTGKRIRELYPLKEKQIKELELRRTPIKKLLK